MEIVNDRLPAFGLGTFEAPFRPDSNQPFNNKWIVALSERNPIKQSLLNGDQIYLSSDSSNFVVFLNINEKGRIAVYTSAVIPTDDTQVANLSPETLKALYEDTLEIRKIFSKSLHL